MIESANAAIEARWETCLTNRDEIELIVDAILPQVTTAEELDALPIGTKLLDGNGDIWTRRIHSWWTEGDQRRQAQDWPSAYVSREAPMSVVWRPEA